MGTIFRPIVVQGKRLDFEAVLAKLIDGKLEALKTIAYNDNKFLRIVAWNGSEYETVDGHEGQRDYTYNGNNDVTSETLIIITESGTVRTLSRTYSYTGTNLIQITRWSVTP
jgi:hypothetical protein